MRAVSFLAAQAVIWALLSDAQSSNTASSVPSSTTAGASNPEGTGSASVRTTISLPPLYSCQYSTWTLPSVYDERTNGTFTWLCDLPAGLSVAAMFYVVQDGASGTNGAQASTVDALINAGSSGTSCLGTNDPSSQGGILSLASSLDPSFSYTADGSQASNGASNGSGDEDDGGAPIGAIVGGVVGGVVGIGVIAALLFYLRHKHNQAAYMASDGLSVYSGTTEKRSSQHHSRYGTGPGSTSGIVPPPAGTYYATDEHGNVHLLMGYPGEGIGQTPYVPPVSEAPMSPAPKTTAPPGMLPEPMDESSTSAPTPVPVITAPTTPLQAPGSTASPAPPASSFHPVTEREGFFGHQGLDDPSSFSPKRNR
ncbi:hypothetical protein Rhopal_000643-T1 [Rhodotorula paludigena]|uniref:Uncharacterized protein n=1 Tax=Rhodotorula paludigena TaxID=86838 RepID=A0AAV5GC85_9BASI|nr:hypothetical protein Rhopal_000643-T1 [Rhodotorula paludigena]